MLGKSPPAASVVSTAAKECSRFPRSRRFGRVLDRVTGVRALVVTCDFSVSSMLVSGAVRAHYLCLLKVGGDNMAPFSAVFRP